MFRFCSLLFIMCGILSTTLPAQQPVAMGNVNLSGAGSQPANSFVTPGHPFSLNPDITGTVANGLGRGKDITDVYVAILPVGTGNAPKLKSVKINGKSANSTDNQTIHLLLNTTTDPKPIKGGASADVEIDLEAADQPAATEFRIRFTPSTPAASYEYDVIGTLSVSAADPSTSRVSSPHGNTRSLIWLENVDDTMKVVSIEGTFMSNGQHPIVSVSLVEPDSFQAISAKVAINGNVFTLTDFSPMLAAQTYAILVSFDGAPTGSTSMKIRATLTTP